MEYIGYALFFAIFVGIIPTLHWDRRTRALPMILWSGGIAFAAGIVIAYLALPGFYGPFWGLAHLFFLGSLISIIYSLLSDDIMQYEKSFVPKGLFVCAALLALVAVRGCIGSKVFQAKVYATLIDDNGVTEKVFTEDQIPVDTGHIAVVPEAQAIWLGKQAIGAAEGALGSRYCFGRYSKQIVKGELYWVAPMEFLNFSSWWTYGETSGFIMISAEDRNRKPKLVINEHCRYLQTAFFGKNLERHIFESGYYHVKISDIHFELDDDLKPWWVVTTTNPSIAWWGDVVIGILLVNPNTGEINPGNGKILLAPKDLPEFVDRVYPEELVEDYLTWYGMHQHGWINSWWQKRGVEMPTPYEGDSNDVGLSYGADGHAKWFTGMTSVSNTDQSLTGFMLVDSRTLETVRYKVSGPNEEAIIASVNNAVSNFRGYRASDPMPYNIFGEFTWVVPVLSVDNLLQRVAFVRASSALLVLGTDVADGVRQYRTLLASSGFSVAPTSQSDIKTRKFFVKRIGVEMLQGKTIYYIYSEDEIRSLLFVVANDLSPELPITKERDMVEITFMDTGEPTVPAISFDNKNLSLISSQKQNEINERRNGQIGHTLEKE
jgi:hypothetical protein